MRRTTRRREFLQKVRDDLVWVDLLTPEYHIRMTGERGIFDARFREMHAAGLVESTERRMTRALRIELTDAGREVLRAWEES